MISVARGDAFSFYSITMISLLESAVPHYVENLAPFFVDDPRTQAWLTSVWLPEEAEHGRLARHYVRQQWPELDWEAAYRAFLAHYQPRCRHELLRPAPALEALARCVTETEAAMIYRCLGAYTKDPELRALLARMSTDEVRHYAYFRDLFDRYDALERNSRWRKATTVIVRNGVVRKEDLALAFLPLNDCWSGDRPFQPLTFRRFLAAADEVIAHFFPFEAASRMLFRPLRRRHWIDQRLVSVLALFLRNRYASRA